MGQKQHVRKRAFVKVFQHKLETERSLVIQRAFMPVLYPRLEFCFERLKLNLSSANSFRSSIGYFKVASSLFKLFESSLKQAPFERLKLRWRAYSKFKQLLVTQRTAQLNAAFWRLGRRFNVLKLFATVLRSATKTATHRASMITAKFLNIWRSQVTNWKLERQSRLAALCWNSRAVWMQLNILHKKALKLGFFAIKEADLSRLAAYRLPLITTFSFISRYRRALISTAFGSLLKCVLKYAPGRCGLKDSYKEWDSAQTTETLCELEGKDQFITFGVPEPTYKQVAESTGTFKPPLRKSDRQIPRLPLVLLDVKQISLQSASRCSTRRAASSKRTQTPASLTSRRFNPPFVCGNTLTKPQPIVLQKKAITRSSSTQMRKLVHSKPLCLIRKRYPHMKKQLDPFVLERMFSRLGSIQFSLLSQTFQHLKSASLLTTVVVRFNPSHHSFRYKDSEFLDSELLEVNWHHRLYQIGLQRVSRVVRRVKQRLIKGLVAKIV